MFSKSVISKKSVNSQKRGKTWIITKQWVHNMRKFKGCVNSPKIMNSQKSAIWYENSELGTKSQCSDFNIYKAFPKSKLEKKCLNLTVCAGSVEVALFSRLSDQAQIFVSASACSSSWDFCTSFWPQQDLCPFIFFFVRSERSLKLM